MAKGYITLDSSHIIETLPSGTTRFMYNTLGNQWEDSYINTLNHNTTADDIYVDLSILANYSTVSLYLGLQDVVPAHMSPNDTFHLIIPKGWSAVYTYSDTDYVVYDLFDANGDLVTHNIKIYGAVTFTQACFTGGTQLLCGDPNEAPRPLNQGDLAGTEYLTEGNVWRSVEDLRAGDLVMTKDSGLQPVLWAGKTYVSTETLKQFPEKRPIIFRRGAIGNDKRLRVSPQHKMLVTGLNEQGEVEERFVAAKHLVNGDTIRIDKSGKPLEYYHVLFDKHEVVKSEGAWSESFYPGNYTMNTLDPDTRSEIEFIVPDLAGGDNVLEAYGETARVPLKRREVEVFLNGGSLKPKAA